MSNSIIQLFQIDAFTSELFKGNPACVMPLDQWLSDELLLKIAKENNVSENLVCDDCNENLPMHEEII